MILDSITTPVEVNGGGTSSSFTIAFNSKAFKVLSSTLYANKCGSIVRELSTNAWDSHVIAKKSDVPFEIHLPDSFEPWFSIKDFGTGMTPTDITTVFTSYFTSTKDQSNDCTGMLGLGSKSPFSYTDQFTVTSVVDSKLYIYNAFMDSDNIPAINLMYSGETTEENGVEIKLSVKREDYSKFKQEVLNQLKYFKVKPNILNGNVDFPSVNTYSIKTNNIGLTDNMYGEKPMIIQGNVGYPIDMAQLSGKIDTANYNFLSGFSNTKVELYFEIGKIGVTASREGIEYTKGTLQNINDKLTVIRSEIKDQILAKLANEATDWDRAVMLNNMPLFARVAPDYLIAGTSKYHGKLSFSLAKLFEIPVSTSVVGIHSYAQRAAVGRYDAYKPTARYQHGFEIEANTMQPLIVLTDKTTRLKEKIKYLFEQKKCARILTVEVNNGIYAVDLADKIKQALGGKANVIKLSDVVLPKKTGVSRVGVKVSTFYKGQPGAASFSASTTSWVKEYESLDDIKTEKVYVNLETNCRNFDWNQQSLLNKYGTIYRLEGGKIPDIICIRETNLKKIKNNPLFVKLEDFITKKLTEYDTEENKKQIRNSMLYHTLNSKYSYDYNDQFKVMKQHCKDHKLTRVLSIALEKHTQYPRHANLQAIAGLINFTPTSVSKVVERFDKVFKLVKSNYALFSKWTKHDTIPAQHFVEYLNAVEAARKAKV